MTRQVWQCAFHLVSAVAAVVFSQVTASSTALHSLVRPLPGCITGHESTMWPIVCHWPQSQSSDAAKPHLCKLARHGPWSVRKQFSSVHDWCGRSKPGCWIVGSHTRWCWLSIEADNQSSSSSVHWAVESVSGWPKWYSCRPQCKTAQVRIPAVARGLVKEFLNIYHI